ncbi:PIN domain-containing protein [Halobacterium rubrum]|uniref:PIN domain-containing protein n=1 Tax=Halobacterium TaxID=2239 RepID=UPI001F3A8D37|nr:MULTISPECIES: PIN domain-containing protein [Halobacterium]MDH5020285.1 PIN domain-containing protein [Halobacterium rubrum]
MILDTSFCISLRAGDQNALEAAAALEADQVPARIPTVVVQELYLSVGYGDNSHQNSRDYERLLANKPVVPLDENIARRAGVLQGEHRAADDKPNLGSHDAAIAATGLTYNEAVLTADEDFHSVERLTVETFEE